MRRPPIYLVLAAIIGLLLAACASPSGSEPGPTGGGGEPSTAAESDAPAESQDAGGGGGGIGGGSGSVDFQMSGGYSVEDELPFVGDLGYWQQAGVTFLVFTDDADATEDTGVVITLGPDGADENNVFQYFVPEELVIPVADCDWNITQNDANGAAGSFTCNDVAGFSASGAPILDIDISGDFQASR